MSVSTASPEGPRSFALVVAVRGVLVVVRGVVGVRGVVAAVRVGLDGVAGGLVVVRGVVGVVVPVGVVLFSGVFHCALVLYRSRKTGTRHPTAERRLLHPGYGPAACESGEEEAAMSEQIEERRGGRWMCPACGIGLRPDDSIVVVTMRPFHAACAEASFTDRATWDHADVTTLSQWAGGIARGSRI